MSKPTQVQTKRGPAPRDPLERLLSRVVVTPFGCWDWQGAKNADGYGRISMGRAAGVHFTHRVAYELLVGAIPDGLQIDHLCRNPSCCNPEHLEPVPQRLNVRRGASAVASNVHKTHCPYGHEFDADNTRLVPKGRRCKACERRRSAESRRRKRVPVSDNVSTNVSPATRQH